MTARKDLLAYENVYDHKGSSSIFMDAMRECVKHHMEHNEFFQKLMADANLSYQDLKNEADLEKIPFIHANFFKKYEVLSVPMEDIVMHATSSGTSGQKSQMFFDQDTFEFGNTMIRNEFRYFGFLSEEPTNFRKKAKIWEPPKPTLGF